MRPHHQKAINKLVEYLKDKPEFLAIIVGGSVTKGNEKENSDIDVILVVTDEEFEKRERRSRFIFYDDSLCDYPDGYIDGKIVNLRFLELAAERGSEPARDAFRDAWVAYSKINDLENLIKKIPLFKKEEKKEKIISFIAQIKISMFFIRESVKRDDLFLLTRGITDLILFSGRLILAHNKVLYPNIKLLLDALENAKEKPDNMIELIETLLRGRTIELAEELCNTVLNYRRWPRVSNAAVRYLIDTEWAWLNGKMYIGDV